MISGKEALIALANGEEVEYYKHEWMDVNRLSVRDLTSSDNMYKFRLKPRTITINGIEVPAPFDPKYDDKYYYLDSEVECGYGYFTMSNHPVHNVMIQFGAWDSEEKIKQVVEALRNVLNP